MAPSPDAERPPAAGDVVMLADGMMGEVVTVHPAGVTYRIRDGVGGHYQRFVQHDQSAREPVSPV